MFNGRKEQQVTILLPNPLLDGAQSYLEAPDWDKLYLWDNLTAKYLGRVRDPVDRSAPKFFQG